VKQVSLDLTTPEGRAAYAAIEKRQKRGRTTRPDIPVAPRQAATGLSGLITRGWSVQSPDAVRYRLYVIGRAELDTGLCATELDACNKAKRLEATQC
jgi:hypothetical protein